VSGFRALHLDGHQADAAIFYAQRCREAGILTSLDGGGVRSNTHELLKFIDVAVASERFCEQLGKTPAETLDYLKSRGCRIGGVTLGERGMIWYDERGDVRSNNALPVPAARIVDTGGAGDVFHGAYVYSYLADRTRSWAQHFRFAEAAAAFKIQRLGNEAGLPALSDIAAVEHEFGAKRPRDVGPVRRRSA
jgi:sugar/nucleoside kinase (ribokinase family)